MPQFPIVALGDSITYGYPFGQKFSWVEKVSKELGLPIANEGVNGNTLSEMRSRIVSDVLDYNPRCVLLMGGVNDVFHGVSLKDMQRHLTDALIFFQKNKIKTVLCLPPPVQCRDLPQLEKNLVNFRKVIKQLAKKKKVPLINFYDPFLDKSKKKVLPSLTEDGVHPSLDGYNRMAETALPVLKKVLKNLKITKITPKNS